MAVVARWIVVRPLAGVHTMPSQNVAGHVGEPAAAMAAGTYRLQKLLGLLQHGRSDGQVGHLTALEGHDLPAGHRRVARLARADSASRRPWGLAPPR